MSQTDALDAIVARLEEAAARLRAGEEGPDEAAALVERCAALATEASAELDRLGRLAASEAPPPAPPPAATEPQAPPPPDAPAR